MSDIVEILIADDHELFRRTLRTFIETHTDWHICGEAGDGAEAVEKAKALHPDIVLMDINMPRMDGLEATRILRRDLPTSKVVIVTQNHASIARQQAASVNAYGSISKSDLTRDLRSTVENVLGARLPGASESSPKEGEELPLERDLLPVQCPPSPSEPNRRRILIADDNADMRQYLARLLSERYDVVAVPDGKLALDDAQEHAPDLVLSDIMMPNLDGFGLLQALRSSAKTSTIPVILLSARAGEEARVEGIDAGADDYLVKPFSARELLARVQTHLELARVRQQANELLRKSEERLRAFVTATADVVYRMSPDWSEMYFLEGKNFIADTPQPSGSWIDRYIHPDDQQQILSAIQDAIRTKGFFHLEHRVLRADGSLGWTSSRAIPLLDQQGEILEWFGAANDISARKQVEQELHDAHKKLELRVQERTRELESVQTDLRGLSGKLLQLQDEERRRIARDLHDSAGQTLAVLGMSLHQLKQLATNGNTQFAAKVNEAQEILQRLTQEVRTTSYLLHPPLLDESGFPTALRVYIDGLVQRTHLKISLTISDNFGRLPRELELAMFRMVQECLTNIIRHADSDAAEIRIFRTPDRIILEVEDHGRGITGEKLAQINEHRAGVGISGMRDRVKHLNGEMKLYSTASGTKVAITLPHDDSPLSAGRDVAHDRSAEQSSTPPR